MNVPFVNLYAQYESIKAEIDKAIESTIKNSSFIGGSTVVDFENAFSQFTGIKNIVACANGTDSIEIILQAMQIGKGDEVIVPATSWISTSEAVSSVAAKPVFVDVEEGYFTINPSLIEKSITPNTKAIIPVHLYGHPAAMNEIMAIADNYNLKVIEDCAQAHGAAIDGKMVGSFGHAASFSFYPGKNLGAYGDAGCMATNDDKLSEKLRMIANHGQQGKHNHVMEGRNSRLDGLQAAILLAKLPHLKKWTTSRISNAADYNALINNSEIHKPACKNGYTHVYHLYVVRNKNRDALQKKLNDAGVESAIHYPKALPFLDCYKNEGWTHDDFPVAAAYQSEILSLPMFAELTTEQIGFVASIINN